MKYEFVSDDSSVNVKAHAPMHDVHGTAAEISGSFDADLSDGVPEGDMEGYAEVRLESFEADNSLVRFNTLRWLKAKKHPVVRFDLAHVTSSADGYEISGELSISGKTGPVVADAAVAVTDDRVEITGTWGFVQSRYGLKAPRLAMLKVDDEIQVEFRLVAEGSE